MPDDPHGYRTPARMLHWGIAAAVLLMIPAGLVMTREGLDRGLQDTLFLFHKNTGVLLLPFILARLAYRLRHPPPPLPASVPGWQRRIAGLSHGLLYVLLIVMPLSGFVRVRAGGFPIELLDALGAGPWLAKSETLAGAAQSLHAAAGFALIALLALHLGAAAQHALILRDGVWSRIWPPRAPR
ncbi:cytochrome b [Paracoccus spongiarum]|uniref:Cytochrome b/b6 domain-containing protein n=1 Tax=Paracoccus spongiarum TaxID=3064387 RepID=A0ABT9JEE5_9RHOB|nr:cytochrome b/b6 domain-containing protein [Paracoccus sp. 2205BS29-5]MDP5308198.1 cytochrome b/b6 domain-containing protein [Paracoccus sp. 2205BS29-5]